MMLNYIIAGFGQELKWLEEQANEEDRKHRLEDSKLTPSRVTEIGLSDLAVELARSSKFVLLRNRNYAYIYRVDEPAKVVTLKVSRESIQKGDYYHRYKVRTKHLRQVKGLVAYLSRSRVLKSISSLETGSVYLYRLAYAIANPGDDIFYDVAETEGRRVEMAHLNRVCCDDRAINLRPMKRWQHKLMDEQLEKIAFQRRGEERTLREVEEYLWTEDTALEDWLEGLTKYEVLELYLEADAA